MKERKPHHHISRRNVLKGLAYSLGVLILTPMSGSGIDTTQTGKWFELSDWNVSVPGLPSVFDGLTILHLTDIHQSPAINANRLRDLRSYIDTLSFDLITVTGDLTYHTDEIVELIEFFDDLPQRCPVLLVMGNHDYWDGGVATLQPLVDGGVRLLRNEHFTIERDGSSFHVAGLDNIWEEMDDLQKVLTHLPETGPTLLMVHEPDVADRVAENGRFFMQISGHSHGGQICLPGGFAPILPWMGQKYFRGYYLVENMMVYTSRGIGMSKPFIRMNCPPEIVLYHFHPGEEPGFRKA